MKFSCTQENFLKGLQIVSHITTKNTHLPILHNVLIEAKESGVTLVSTNLEMGMRVQVRGKVEETGSITIPAQVLTNYMTVVTADRVDVEQQQTDVNIQAGNQHAKMKGESANEFPLIPEVEKKEPVIMDAMEFKQSLAQVCIAASRDDSRPELTGVLCRIKDKQLILVATDSYRLAERKVPLVKGSTIDRSIIIPATTLSELARVLPDSETEVLMYATDTQALFVTDGFEMTTRLIEGTFPDYEQIIPEKEHTKVIVEKEGLVKAIKAASLFSRSGIHDVNLHFSPEKQAITLTTVNNQVGENVTRLEAEIVGESNNTIFNHRYMLDGLANIPTQKVALSLVDNMSPGVFRPHGEQNGSYLYIVMPIKQ